MADIVHIIDQSRNALVSGRLSVSGARLAAGPSGAIAFILVGFQDVETCRDYGGNERVTLGRYYQ
ncbi:hypothetical protein ACNKHK_07775 [Shigella flexneri]